MSGSQTQFIHFPAPGSSSSIGGESATDSVAISYDFMSFPPFEDPLIPPSHQWPAFDSAVVYTLSPTGSPSSSCESSPSPNVEGGPLPDADSQYPTAFPSPAALASMPIPPSRGSSRNKSPDHVPRPRNAFMLFRSAFAAAQKISTNIEHDNRHITRIIAHCWNRLSDTDKQVWRDKAAAEKAQHAERYPNYRFSPVGRTNKPVKRNVRRNGVEDRKRCEKVAELLLAGKHGKELESAVKEIDVTLSSTTEDSEQSQCAPLSGAENPQATILSGWHPRDGDSEECDIRPFRSPLLPPAKAASAIPPESPSKNITLPPLASITGAYAYFMPQNFPPTDTSTSEAVYQPSFWDYQPNMREDIPSPRSTSPPGHYQPIMNFLQPDHNGPDFSPPDFSGFSWEQDSFSTSSTSSSSSYYH
ncbi:hypothetical protein HYDPIDRAFT_25078 [Hydnomerulius pinastri MD-312]|nr:hypothetical protein HYDPIDRAFT_25078 [Hydnomerulius pinastri MD-312]